MRLNLYARFKTNFNLFVYEAVLFIKSNEK